MRGIHFLQQAEIGIVDQLPFLAFLDRFDRQPDLFAELVNFVAVKIGHARVRAQHRLDGAQMIFARVLLVIHEGGRQFRFAAVHGEQVHFDFAEFIGGFALGRLGDAVDAIDAAIHIHPRAAVCATSGA